MQAHPRPVFVVEDDPKIARLLADYLAQAGFSTRCIGDGAVAVASIEREAPALVLLDLMLPGLDGLEVCRAVRRFSDVPIIMITARVDEIDRLLGLEIGADDYVCKPFSPREVVARVRAILRRTEAARQSLPAVAGFEVDEGARRIRYQGEALPLTPIEFRLFATLLRQPGRVFPRAQLLDAVHDDLRDVSDRAIDSHVKNLRRKLAGTAAGDACVASVYGVGYRFDEP
ncbi:MAG: response regulator [Burkholderiaceae bacterium]